MTVTKTLEAKNFRKLMHEVQLGYMTPEGASGIIDEYIRAEVLRYVSYGPDIELALHPLTTVQQYADSLERDQDRFGDRMVATLVREYAMLRRRLADDRLRAMADLTPIPVPAPRQTLPPTLKNAEQQLFDALRDLGQAQVVEPSPPPDRRKKDRRDK